MLLLLNLRQVGGTLASRWTNCFRRINLPFTYLELVRTIFFQASYIIQLYSCIFHQNLITNYAVIICFSYPGVAHEAKWQKIFIWKTIKFIFIQASFKFIRTPNNVYSLKFYIWIQLFCMKNSENILMVF